MKKLFQILAIAATLVACSKDETVPEFGTYALTGYATVETKTDFGTPVTDGQTTTIPFEWSAGDKMWNGLSTSDPLETGGSSATFVFSTEPAGAVYYNMTGASATAALILADQDASKTLGQNGDFGYATVQDGSFALNHATSYIWFKIEGAPSGAVLKSISIDAKGTIISGAAGWMNDELMPSLDGSDKVTLAVNKDVEEIGSEAAELVMVVIPAEIGEASVKYELDVDGTVKYYDQDLGSKTLMAGTTYKVSFNFADAQGYELRTLTFEDEDPGSPYWEYLIDDQQYGGTLLYANGYYEWLDENTQLYHYLPAGIYWTGGHAISNYVAMGYSNEDRNIHIAKWYGEDYVTQWAGNDAMLGWFNVQLTVPSAGGHSGSNFAVHYGYQDYFNYGMFELSELSFYDGEPRVIDHMYVMNTNYALNQLMYGVGSEAGNSFGGAYAGPTEDSWFKVTAYGYASASDDEPSAEVDFYLLKGTTPVLEWTKWDLTSLGKVEKVVFNLFGSDDMGGSYGFTIPAYFAYDDVAVRFED